MASGFGSIGTAIPCHYFWLHEIHDAALEARIQKQLQATGSSSVEEVLLPLLETQEEQDRWLLENRQTIDATIRRGIDQLDRAEESRKINWMLTWRN